jgi:hypothetical protein
MSYTLKGVLQGRLGPDDVEPIAEATVKTGVPGVNFEVGGPDLYFRIETEDGRLLIDETKAAGSQSGRHNVEAVYFTEIPVHPGAAGR